MPRMAEKRSASAPAPSSASLAPPRARRPPAERAPQGVPFLVGLGELGAQIFAAYGAVGAHVDELEAAAIFLRSAPVLARSC
jgi:hypothetical protein